jgi:cold shock CspA family protein
MMKTTIKPGKTGAVRWYSAQGYGFIDVPGEDEPYYFHITAVSGRRILKPEQQVSFVPTKSPKGLRAINVMAVETKDKTDGRIQPINQ